MNDTINNLIQEKGACADKAMKLGDYQEAFSWRVWQINNLKKHNYPIEATWPVIVKTIVLADKSYNEKKDELALRVGIFIFQNVAANSNNARKRIYNLYKIGERAVENPETKEIGIKFFENQIACLADQSVEQRRIKDRLTLAKSTPA